MLTEGWIVYIVLMVEVVNLCLISGLLYIYWKSYKRLKSKFTIGLVFFSTTFLIKSIILIIGLLAFILFSALPQHYAGDRSPFPLFLVNVIECIALSILLKITWE